LFTPFQSIEAYQKALVAGTTTCVAAVEYYISNIQKNAHLNAFTHTYFEEALEKAKELDLQRHSVTSLSPLHGVVVALKDVICYKDHPVTASSKILSGFQSLYNATAVEKLLQAGAVIIGNTNCDEFAMGSTNENSFYGKVLNAIDESRVPGGSSGGAAVAVQADLCMVSLGSDTGGSVRQPADFCGIVGLKPSYGRISRYGLLAYASSFDQIGIFAKSIPDVALVLEQIAGPDTYDSTVAQVEVPAYSKELDTAKAGKKIAYFKEALESDALDPEIKEQILRFIKELQADGYTVEPVNFEFLDYIVPTYYILTTAEASSNLSRYDGVRYGYRVNLAPDKKISLEDFYKINRSEGFGWEVKKRILLGTFVLSEGYFDAYFTKAQQVRQLLKQKTELIFRQFDALILPTSPSTAFKIGEKTNDPIEMYLADIFTVFANLVGVPGISVPLFWHKNGMPYGIQIMTSQFSELSLLRLSHQWMLKYRATGN
jgi:aspartyl-tRNA(Asn)/glutamyl-tRNA(Gln) amidotransferase subunit A